MSKNLPPYLENILDFLAEKEAEQSGVSIKEAKKKFREELVQESLTAKANPVKENPTKPKAREAVDAGKTGSKTVQNEFLKTELLKQLEPEVGKKVFERTKALAVSLSNIFLKKSLGLDISKGTNVSGQYEPNALQYPKGFAKLSLEEKEVKGKEIEANRYYRLAFVAISLAYMMEAFKVSPGTVRGFVQNFFAGKSWNTIVLMDSRRKFFNAVFDEVSKLLRDQRAESGDALAALNKRIDERKKGS